MKLILTLALIFSGLTSFSQTGSDTATTRNICPVCSSHSHVIPIIYGKPGKELIKKAEREECKLGGCRVSKDSPMYYCRKDKREF